ncbi:hypothetical protein S40288_00320 [Stachybotrys chartarum IBT 40288]|nr:hypothetical protein S40288_00320 [Stachybotrys chartarum IBT 40288]
MDSPIIDGPVDGPFIDGPAPFGNINLSVVGLGTQYPSNIVGPDALDILSSRFYRDTPVMQKVLGINRKSGIKTRPSVISLEHPLMNRKETPSITDQHNVFMSEGVPLAVSAARKAISEAKLDVSEITHIVATTCTDTANPGYDHYVAKQLGLPVTVERVLLHGVGCSGGLAALRTAANLALGHTARGKPARVLCVALEVCTLLAKAELDLINDLQETRIGACLFSDGASSVVLSNGIGNQPKPIYELLGWEYSSIPEADDKLRFDADPTGWRVVLSPLVPKITSSVIQPTYNKLLESLPYLPAKYQKPSDFDWAMHPGGISILKGTETIMGVSEEHLRASYATYNQFGNTSSVSILSVLDRLRTKEMDSMAQGGRIRDHVVGCAFGPGITIEMCMLKRVVGTQN